MSSRSPRAEIEGLSRREALRRIALALTAAGSLDFASAQQVHSEARRVRDAEGGYTPRFFTEHEFKTLSLLAELIVPADGLSGSAVDAGAPEFIDLLCSQNSELAHIYTGGVAWFDSRMRKEHGKDFVDAGGEQQTAFLDALVEEEQVRRERRLDGGKFAGAGPYIRFRDYGVDLPSDAGPGLVFFDWIRKMTVDAYYTSEIGMKDLGYAGNGAYSEYAVPQEAIDYAMRRPFGAQGD